MKKIPLDGLPERAYFSDLVFLDRRYVLTSPDIALSSEMKERLQSWGFSHVYSDGVQADTDGEEAADLEDTSAAGITSSLEEEQQQNQAEAFFKEVAEFVQTAFDRYRQDDELRMEESSETVKRMMAEVKANRHFLLSVQESRVSSPSHLTTHAVRTTLLSLAIADYLKLPPFKQIDLGLAALYHQIGMLKLPEEIYTSERSLTEQERKMLTAHPAIGFRTLKGAGFPAGTCQAVLEHNERLDGSGVPRGIRGTQMSDYGKILAVAGSYCAATADRPYRSGYDGHTGIMDLMKDAGSRYEEKVLAALVFILSFYPAGTYVLMSNGAVGIVVKPNPESPKYPAVRLLVDEQGHKYRDQPIVQTRRTDDVHIQKALRQEELADLGKST